MSEPTDSRQQQMQNLSFESRVEELVFSDYCDMPYAAQARILRSISDEIKNKKIRKN